VRGAITTRRIKSVRKVQRRFTKMIKGMKGKSYEERLQKLNLWSLEERRNRQDVIEVFKICKGLSRIRPEELFHLDDRGKDTRGYSVKLVKVRCSGTPKDIFSNRVLKRWNQLDQGGSRCDKYQRL